MYETILVPVDGSDGANRAVEHALELSERYGAALHAVFVVDTARYGEPALSTTEIVVDALDDEGMALLSELADRVEDSGTELTHRIRHGAPHEEIIAYAEETDADLLVMGYQGLSHGNTQIGSVANRVARLCDRPLLLV